MLSTDLVISVGIWVSGLGMSLLGIEMTIHPPVEGDNKKWWYRSIFIVLGISFIGLSVWQFDRLEKKETLAMERHQNEQIRNEGNLKYMQGQLDTINKVLGTLSNTSGLQQTVAILKSLLPQMPQVIGPGQTALEKMSNKQLRSKVLEFVRLLREMNAKYDQLDRQSTDQWRADSAKLVPTDQQGRQQAFQQMNQRQTAISNQFHFDYKSDFAVDAVSYRNELIRRLGPQVPLGTGKFRTPLSLDGWIAPMSVEATADYLEMMAKKIPE